jgi:hypothetical protein
MSKEQDPAKFWREQSLYHQHRADFWKKTSRVLMGVLVGIAIVTWIASLVTS